MSDQPVIPLANGKYLIPNPAAAKDFRSDEITRTIAIEHKGEKIAIEVHVHLSQDEIERIVTPAVLKSLSRQLRSAGRPMGVAL